MPAALLDTNAISDLMRGDPQVISRIAHHTDIILTSVVVIGEIHYGLSRLPIGTKRAGLEARAQHILAPLRIEDIGEQIATSYGRLKASLEAGGLNLGDNDVWIAATALTRGYVLVTRDHIFSQVPGLVVEDWTV
jgi:tRNA(fMet)-specific endonuclease VapC